MNRDQILQIAKPILFNTDMVAAILDDAKTETRRVIKPQPILSDGLWQLGFAGWSKGLSRVSVMPGHSLYKKAPYKPGEYLYVRETWCNINKPGAEPDYYYFADTRICEDYDPAEWKWRPSIHMPKEAARIFLRVNNIWIERLRNIDAVSAKAEGIKPCNVGIGKEDVSLSLIIRYSALWNTTIPKKDLYRYGWNANPWVWATQFEKVEV